MKTRQEMRQEVKAYLAGLPEGQINTGVYATCGTKYVTLVNTWETTTTSKITIEEFYKEYC